MAMSQQHKHALTKNRVRLVRELSLTEELLAELQSDYTLTRAMVEEIEVCRTSSSKAGKLLDILPKRGANAFSTFISALLNTHQEHLAELLDPSRASSSLSSGGNSGHIAQATDRHRSGVDPSKASSSSHGSSGIISQATDNRVDKVAPSGVTKSGYDALSQQKQIQNPQKGKENPFPSTLLRQEDINQDVESIVKLIRNLNPDETAFVYELLTPADGEQLDKTGELKNGKCAIFRNNNSKDSCDTVNDDLNLDQSLKNFGISVSSAHENKTEQDIMQLLYKEADTETSALILLMFVNGRSKDGFLGQSRWKSDTDRIVEIFKKSNALKGKPKILIFQSIDTDSYGTDSVVHHGELNEPTTLLSAIVSDLSLNSLDDDNLAVMKIIQMHSDKIPWFVWSLVMLVTGFSRKYDVPTMLAIVKEILIREGFLVSLQSCLKNGLYFAREESWL